MSEKSDFLYIPAPLIWRHTAPSAVKNESAVNVGRPPALKLKNWKTETQRNSQIPWKQGLILHTKAYRRWYLSATTHCEYLTKRSLSVHITEIVRATNCVLDRTEMNIYELTQSEGSGWNDCSFRNINIKPRDKIVGNQLQFDWITIKVQVSKHFEHWSIKMVLLYNEKMAVDVPDCKMMMKILVEPELLDRYCSTISR